jgi:hypothetical protein
MSANINHRPTLPVLISLSGLLLLLLVPLTQAILLHLSLEATLPHLSLVATPLHLFPVAIRQLR